MDVVLGLEGVSSFVVLRYRGRGNATLLESFIKEIKILQWCLLSSFSCFIFSGPVRFLTFFHCHSLFFILSYITLFLCYFNCINSFFCFFIVPFVSLLQAPVLFPPFFAFLILVFTSFCSSLRLFS